MELVRLQSPRGCSFLFRLIVFKKTSFFIWGGLVREESPPFFLLCSFVPPVASLHSFGSEAGGVSRGDFQKNRFFYFSKGRPPRGARRPLRGAAAV